MVFFHTPPAPSAATAAAASPIASRKKNSPLLESALKDLQETLCARTSKFHVQVSVPSGSSADTSSSSRFFSRNGYHRHHPHKCHSCIPVQNEQDLPHTKGLSVSPLKYISDRISTFNPPPHRQVSAIAPSEYVPAPAPSSSSSSSSSNAVSSVSYNSALPPIHGSGPNSAEYIESPAVSRIRSKIGLNVYHNLSLMHNRLQNLPSNLQQSDILNGPPESDENSRAVPAWDGHQDRSGSLRTSANCGGGDADSDSDSDISVSAISWKLSALKDDIKSLSQGHQSPKKQLELLRQRHESTQASIQSLEEGQLSLRDKILSLEQATRERDKSLEIMKLDRIRSISQTRNDTWQKNYHNTLWPHDQSSNTVLASRGDSSEEMMKITEFWNENNCDFHVNKIIHSLRKVAAYEILEFCHNRLSSHMIRHISETLQELSGEKRASYLKMLGFPEWLKAEKDCTEHLSSLSLQVTYAELLEFVNQQMQEGKRVKKELFAALKSAERGLLEEAERESYDKDLVGDIRWQMTGFKVLERSFRNAKYDQSMAKFQKLEETKDIVADIIKTIEEGDLGVLERSAKLIRLGCYFLERHRLLNPPSAAEELDSLNIDADFQG